MDEVEVAGLVPGLEHVELRRWIDVGWVRPASEDGRYRFREVDVARVRLVHEIIVEMHIGEDSIPLILSLLDQVYGLRRQLRSLASAIEAEPEDVRRSIARRMGPPED